MMFSSWGTLHPLHKAVTHWAVMFCSCSTLGTNHSALCSTGESLAGDVITVLHKQHTRVSTEAQDSPESLWIEIGAKHSVLSSGRL